MILLHPCLSFYCPSVLRNITVTPTILQEGSCRAGVRHEPNGNHSHYFFIVNLTDTALNPLDILVITCDHPPPAITTIQRFAQDAGMHRIEEDLPGPGGDTDYEKITAGIEHNP